MKTCKECSWWHRYPGPKDYGGCGNRLDPNVVFVMSMNAPPTLVTEVITPGWFGCVNHTEKK